MKRVFRKLTLAALMAAVALAASGCVPLIQAMLVSSGNDALSRAEIAALVEENRALLLEDIEARDFARTLALPGVQEVFDALDTEGYVACDCGGWGIVSEGGYVGFCYAVDGGYRDCGALGLSGMVEVPVDDGRLWRQEGGDNAYFTAPLGEGFYYYEEHF